ncbi:MFS transporter [Acinetobacter gerneri]|uniref:MFS transporter n=1 Tax=Acinetobacter gerneri TaxID=202952 RepID=A0AAW8JK30_9GAMM|nr:MFS transporter [Acinetobacter gerneri]MDQ9010507.1 MFS transporter [Acinetobacter gerneri]MDQ9014706.1 MFS transporter [Acinetobacter gerneri]MDQ9025819.1 MFS transporter [Acinetobacter gerneri]MDQ9053158.1 MFS transporter [Acinetobacter gerneri]MDQ9060776.1 MFS transporter [Acinetobacter gerneri]
MKSQIYTPTIILMAIAIGICAGGNYFSQPLIHSMSVELKLTETTTAWVPTIAQAAYACGLLFLMPLGDILEKRRLLFIMMLLASFGLLISGFSTNIYILLLGTLITGLFSSSAQLMIPLAASLAPANSSGRIVGFLISGLMLGILLARSFAGLLSTLFSWHVIYVICGSILLITTFILYRNISPFPPEKTDKYLHTMQTLYQIFRENSRLRLRAYIGGLTFAGISIIFTTMSLLLAPAPYHFSDFTIGLFGLVGIIGVFLANFTGKFIDKGYAHRISILCGIGLIVSWLFFYSLSYSLIFYVIATVIIYSSLSAIHVTNQSIVYQLSGTAKSRFNAIYMTGYFLGAALGTTTGIYAWRHFGWNGACILGLCYALCCFMLCVVDAFNENKKKLIT